MCQYNKDIHLTAATKTDIVNLIYTGVNDNAMK